MAHRGEYKVPPEVTAQARAGEGIPVAGVTPAPAPQGLDLLALLKGGQFSAGALMQLIAMLTGMGQMPGGMAQGGGSPIEAAMMGGEY